MRDIDGNKQEVEVEEMEWSGVVVGRQKVKGIGV